MVLRSSTAPGDVNPTARNNTIRKKTGTAAVRLTKGGSHVICIKKDPINQHLMAAMPKRIPMVIQKENSWRIAPTSNIVQKTNHANTFTKPSIGLSL